GTRVTATSSQALASTPHSRVSGARSTSSGSGSGPSDDDATSASPALPYSGAAFDITTLFVTGPRSVSSTRIGRRTGGSSTACQTVVTACIRGAGSPSSAAARTGSAATMTASAVSAPPPSRSTAPGRTAATGDP